MLSTLRKQTGSIFIKGLLGLLILSFGAWGIQDWLSPAISGNFVASVGDQDIPPNQLQRRVQLRMNNLRSILGNDLTLEQASQFGLVGASLNELVSRALMVEGANSMGVAISDDLVSADIRSNKSFKGLTGAFDRNNFERVLQSNGMSEGSYIADLRQDMGIEHFANSLTYGVGAPKAMVDALYAYRNQTRVVDVMSVEDASIQNITDPDQTTLEAFHKSNAKRFTAPEYRKLTYILLDANALAKDIEVTEQQILESYEARASEFTTTEKRHVLQMILSTEDKVKAAQKLLSEGREFSVVAKEIGGHDEGTVDLGLITKEDMLPGLATAAFAVAADTVSEPVKSAFGWHLFKVTEIQAGGVIKLSEVHDQVKAALAKEKAIDGMFDLSNRLEDQLGGGATIEETGQNLGLQVHTIAAIDRNGVGPDSKPVGGIPGMQAFLSAAFNVEEGEESQLTETGPEGFFIVRVDTITAPALRPLESIRTEVVNAWKDNQRAEKAKAIAEKVLNRLNAGDDLEAVAKENNLSVKVSKPFARTDQGQVSQLAGALVGKVFDLAVGKAALERSASGYQVARLKEVIAVVPGADQKGLKTLRDELTSALQGDVIVQLGESLRKDVSIEVNQPLVNQLFSTQ